ncbi:MAG: RNA methyltransferase [Planctomycetes bacterium]|nr:RNA methyltransferase [Planctomycetota bacterium]
MSERDTPLSRCRVVLVRPQFAANVGAAARAMRNMGLSDLALVAPHADLHDRQARQLSTHGEEVLDRARSCVDLGEALVDCVAVAATSARKGGLFRRQSVGLPEEVASLLVESLATGPVALVFGPERTGLHDDEVSRCHHLIHIPADPSYPALNLAQAVAICLYEVRCAWLRRTEDRPLSLPGPPAPFADQERAFENLRIALKEIHYLYGERGAALMHGLRHLLGRARPTAMEVRLLLGLARQIRWFVRHGREMTTEQ